MDRLGDLIPASLKKAGAERTVKAALVARAVEAAAAKAVPESAGGVTMTVFRNGVARVRCRSSAVAEELRLRADDVVADANAALGGDHVRKLVAVS